MYVANWYLLSMEFGWYFSLTPISKPKTNETGWYRITHTIHVHVHAEPWTVNSEHWTRTKPNLTHCTRRHEIFKINFINHVVRLECICVWCTIYSNSYLYLYLYNMVSFRLNRFVIFINMILVWFWNLMSLLRSGIRVVYVKDC